MLWTASEDLVARYYRYKGLNSANKLHELRRKPWAPNENHSTANILIAALCDTEQTDQIIRVQKL